MLDIEEMQELLEFPFTSPLVNNLINRLSSSGRSGSGSGNLGLYVGLRKHRSSALGTGVGEERHVTERGLPRSLGVHLDRQLSVLLLDEPDVLEGQDRELLALVHTHFGDDQGERVLVPGDVLAVLGEVLERHDRTVQPVLLLEVRGLCDPEALSVLARLCLAAT